MTTRQGPGGRVPPDGRPAQAKGVGKNAKRHDLEKPKATLAGTDLQSGDVQAMEEGQRIVGKKTQAPAQAQTGTQASQPAPAGGGALQTPDPRAFMQKRLGNTLQGGVGPVPDARPIDPNPWLPLIESMATAPNAGGMLAAAYIESLSAAAGRHAGQVHTLDMNDLDQKVQQLGT